MTTKKTGGIITGRVALTLEATYAAAKGDPVHVSADWAVALADGSKPVVGYVTTRNVGRGTLAGGNAGMYPVPVTPGDVTVEAFGWGVKDFTSGEAIVAGTTVGIGNDHKLHPAGGGVANIGIALNGVAGANLAVDVLEQ